MPRRSIVKPGRTRKIIALLGCFMLLFTAIACTMRITRYWNTFDSTGAGTYRSIVIEHGILTIDSNTGPFAPSPGTLPIFNWQVDPGLKPTTFAHRRTSYPAPLGGMAVANIYQFGVAIPLGIVGILFIILTLPLRKMPPGTCRCGYNLSGIASKNCPECGAAIQGLQSA